MHKANAGILTMELAPVKQALEGKTIRKVMAVPGKLVNIVAG